VELARQKRALLLLAELLALERLEQLQILAYYWPAMASALELALRCCFPLKIFPYPFIVMLILTKKLQFFKQKT
jgi:hypothetical protein